MLQKQVASVHGLGLWVQGLGLTVSGPSWLQGPLKDFDCGSCRSYTLKNNLRVGCSGSMLGLPQIRSTFFVVPETRIILFCWLYWVPCFEIQSNLIQVTHFHTLDKNRRVAYCLTSEQTLKVQGPK